MSANQEHYVSSKAVINGEMRIFNDKDKLKQFMSTKLALQKILKGIIHTEAEKKQPQA
jgi:hypothetical protein